MLQYRRLPLHGLINARDLGGFSTTCGVTKFGVLVRSEVPAALTPEDLSFLKNYGVKYDVDLRSKKECVSAPDVLARENWLTYVNIPMYDENAAKGICIGDEKDAKFSWADHYVRMIECSKDWILEVLTVLEKANGCVIFHCATGKDRTGLITMALLGLCGVSDEDIISDYSVSSIFLQPIFREMLSDGKAQSLDDPFFSTAPENMALLLNYINSKYGDIPAYLKYCGVSDTIIGSLQNRFVQNS